MTGQQAEIQWYIARDGKQHGPLSDIEMRTFVAQGHLKPTDLIWRPGFADWRPAPAVFPFQQPPPPAAPPPGRPAAQSQQGLGARPEPAARGPVQGGQPSFEPDRIRVAQGGEERGGSRIGKVAAVIVLLALIGGGGFYAWKTGAVGALQDKLTAGKEGEQVPTISAPLSGSPGATAPPVPPAQLAAGAEELDGKFAKLAAWGVVKREFPDWYGEQLKQAAALTAQSQPDDVVNKHLAESLVSLRRQHANEALAASTPRLKEVATAFLNNLKTLANKSVGACYGFISQGETSPAVIEVLQQPEQGAAVQAQIAAIFEAIADGRKSPSPHDRAVKEDYDILVQELTKLGWKEQDLQTFSNPSLLAREPPERVCQMVQDWFSAHLAIADAAAQERLLVETLKPVVSG
jgi:hypothetical protein